MNAPGTPAMRAPLVALVGVPGFEPGASCSQSRRATKLRHTPHACACRPRQSRGEERVRNLGRVRSSAPTAAEYLAELPADRREALEAVRQVILTHLPDGLVETMAWGMICYVVPRDTFGDTYNGQPLVHTALANQKQYMSLYLHSIYGDEAMRERFEAAYLATGKRYDVGKSCVRFRRLEDLPLDVVGETIESASAEDLIAQHQRAMASRRSRRVR